MKIKEFIEKVNEHDGMRAKKVDKKIVIGTPNNMGILSIPEDATNFIEIDTWATSNSLYWKKADREYLSALIEEFLYTPVKERFSEKKYHLVVNPDARKVYGNEALTYVSGLSLGNDHLTFWFGAPATYSEGELEDLKQICLRLAPAINAMKEPVEDDE